MRKWVSALAVGLSAVMIAGCGNSASSTTISVDSVGNITGLGSVGITDKFSGMVVSEEEVKVNKNSNLSVKEVKVKEGDVVKTGQVLFTYDTDSLQLTLEKQQLELEQLQATIENKNKENKQLQKDAKGAKGSTKLEYTVQIQSNEADIKEAEYNSKLKEKEIEETKKSIDDVNVTSPIDGTVKSIAKGNQDGNGSDAFSGDDGSSDDGSDDSSSGASSAFIVLTKSDSLEIKGTLNELSAKSLSEGMPLLIRSRTDSTQTWTGTLSRIDFEKGSTSSGNSSYGMSDSSDSSTTSTKYPFYVSLDSEDGLILGQHVYIETNVDDSEASDEAAFSLPSYYIVDADTDSPYVWAEKGSKLEKKNVTLGEYDADTDEYPVISGLDLTDYIAFPSEDCKAGEKTEHMDAAGNDGENGGENGGADAGMPEGGMTDDAGMTDEGDGGAAMDDGAYTQDGEEGMTEDDEAVDEDEMTDDTEVYSDGTLQGESVVDDAASAQ